MENRVCPLCENGETQNFFQDLGRQFFKCRRCQLIYVPDRDHLSFDAERERYSTHQNNPADPEYRKFLSRLLNFLRPKLQTGQKGLDFGSGPGPTVSVMMGEWGFFMENYDPFFAPHSQLLEQQYDFITCTETVEHLRRPRETWSLLDRLLKPGGILGVMTQWVEKDEEFPGWYYHRDPTHLCFYRRDTLNWIACNFGWHCVLPRPHVALFEKRQDS